MQTFLEYINAKHFDKKLISKVDGYNVFIVNASAIRDHDQGDDEFNHYATNLMFPDLVPKDEIWLSRDLNEKERTFLIHNGLHQYEGKRKGVKDWYTYALNIEKSEREKIDGVKFKGKVKDKHPPEKIYYKHYCDIPSKNEKIEVWLVNGEMIRDLYKTDFILGGNGGDGKTGVYPWIPAQEIWVEKNIIKEKNEVDIVILHEYIEQTLMRYNNFTYDKAHVIAAKVDWHHRGKWTKKDVESLTREKALKMAEKYLR